MRARHARAALAALLVLPLGAFAASKDGYDYEAAGGAASMGPMYRGAVEAITGWCSAELPSTAGDWRDVQGAWQARNARWLAASDTVLKEALDQLRAEGEDPAEIEAALETIVADYIGEVMGDVKAGAKRDGAAVACERLAGFVEGGGLDIERHEFAPGLQMLRKHLPAAAP